MIYKRLLLFSIDKSIIHSSNTHFFQKVDKNKKMKSVVNIILSLKLSVYQKLNMIKNFCKL